jgi:hypothetical protein
MQIKDKSEKAGEENKTKHKTQPNKTKIHTTFLSNFSQSQLT